MKASKLLVTVCAAALIALAAIAQPARAQEQIEKDAKAAAAAGEKEVQHNEHVEHASGAPNPLAVDPDLAIWTGVVFLVLFGLLSKFAWPQISAALVEREKKIEDQLASAVAKHEEAKRLLSEHEAKLAATAGEVRGLLEEARRDAEVTKSRIVAEARKAGEDEKNRALLEINRAKEGAVHELATASANVAIDLARRVVQEKITPEEHAKVVRDALGKLAAANPSKN